VTQLAPSSPSSSRPSSSSQARRVAGTAAPRATSLRLRLRISGPPLPSRPCRLLIACFGRAQRPARSATCSPTTCFTIS
jgi:hypothetical protein